MALAVTLVAASMFPSNMKSSAGGEVKPRSFVNFVYLAAFCTHVGAQFWMTFISGELYKQNDNKNKNYFRQSVFTTICITIV